MNWQSAIVLTTIGIPYSVNGYVSNFHTFGHANTGIIIIGDRRTPEEKVKEIVDKSNNEVPVEFWGVQRQCDWLKNYPKLEKIVPYDSDNRRNIGFLIAAEKGAETIISIDDDNYVSSMDFLGFHSVVGKSRTMKTVRSKNNWYNPCRVLIKNPPWQLYPRGFPFSRRSKNRNIFYQSSGKIMMNVGLWLDDPDADAITNLCCPTKILKMQGKNVMLAPGTFAPINTQNTAFSREVLPSYYYVKMGLAIHGLRLDRYGDIWSGFFVKKVLDKLDHRVSIGLPLTEHHRNKHDLFKDMKAELWGMIVTEKLANWIEKIDLNGNSYRDAYCSLAGELETFHPEIGTSSRKVNEYFKEISSCMRTWVETCDLILHS
jgi:hypothetical protein